MKSKKRSFLDLSKRGRFDRQYVIIPIIVILFIGLVFGSGCVRQPEEETGPAGAFIGGSDGLTLSFMADAPPSEVEECIPFDIAVQVKNKGESNIDNVDLILGGTIAHRFGLSDTAAEEEKKLTQSIPGLAGYEKIGKEVIPGEDWDVYWYTDGPPNYPGQQDITVTAKACYDYETKVQATACIKESTYRQATGAPELCKSSGEIKFFNSGSPVHVTSIKQRPVSGGPDTKFTINIENVGKGTAYEVTKSCRNLSSKEANKIILKEARLVNLNKVAKDCTATGKNVINLPGHISCQFDITSDEAADEFEDVLVLTFEYGYTQDISKKITVLNTMSEECEVTPEEPGVTEKACETWEDCCPGAGGDATLLPKGCGCIDSKCTSVCDVPICR